MHNNFKIDISIIIPFNNQEKYILDCLKSVLNQTFINYEIILINDGSTDNTEKIIKPYLTNDRIRYYYQENKGISASRNIGIEKANGKYICFIDSDDYVEQDYLETLYNNAEDADIVKCLVTRVIKNGEEMYKQKTKHLVVSTSEKINYLQDYSVWAKLIKKSFIKENNLSFPIGEEYEDTCFSIVANSICSKFKVINYYGYYYRMNPYSITTNKEKIMNPKIPYKGFEKSVCFLIKYNGIKDKDLIEFEILRSITSFLTNTFYKCNDNKRKELVEYCINIIERYMPNLYNNKYILKTNINAKLYHKIAIKLFVLSYKKNKIYIYSLFVSYILRIMNTLGIYK